ncbi:MAG: pyridoxal 5'-phosphate synthase, partial [Gammaproteobacteria bacterium]|nr:pyridoxal 5'-phosphate synthase [Gammaproteobacteria bacterium]
MKLEDQRREYNKSHLRRKDLNDDPIIQLQTWLEDASHLGVIDSTAMTLATVNQDGQPSQRVVLLKHLDEKGLVFYTNLNSRKAQDIKVNSKVSANFSWLSLERQVKVEGVATQLSAKETLNYFITRPRESQIAAWASNQSHSIT